MTFEGLSPKKSFERRIWGFFPALALSIEAILKLDARFAVH